MGLPRQYPMREFPYSQNAEEEAYHQKVYYLSSALFVFGAADHVLSALREVWQQVMDQALDPERPISLPGYGR
jgi:hypothetical protein